MFAPPASWSQRSISRSLQRAETLLKSTFNPSLKWLFHGRSQDEAMEEGNFVVAPNLVSRSSARLLRLQHALLTVAPQWQQVGGSPQVSPGFANVLQLFLWYRTVWYEQIFFSDLILFIASSFLCLPLQVCVKGLPAEGEVVYLPSSSSSFLQGHYRALWKLLEQRSLLLFTHEYIRRVRLATAFISRVSRLLEEQLKKSHLNRVRLHCSYNRKQFKSFLKQSWWPFNESTLWNVTSSELCSPIIIINQLVCKCDGQKNTF